jgi:chromate transporter
MPADSMSPDYPQGGEPTTLSPLDPPGPPHGSRSPTVARGALGEVVRLFLRLGVVGFGGPAAHIAMMEDEVVRRRSWLSRERFLDLLAATNLIPGPNSTEMAIHLGYVRAGWPGLVLGGACFILPATLIVLALAAAYVRWGQLPAAGWLFYGIKPVIVAVIVQALWRLARTALATPSAAVVAGAVVVLTVAGANELLLLVAAALALAVARGVGRSRDLTAGLGLVALPASLLPVTATAASVVPASPSLVTLSLIFLKVGSILFGSGYVLLAFLRPDLVERTGWLTDRQLLDAIAVGQLTPGPVLTTATFVGYLVAGVPGALVATVGIFLPSFVLVAVSSPLVPRIRRSAWAAGLLDGASAGAVALMAWVTWPLGRAALVDLPAALLALAAGTLLFGTRLNSAWLVAGGALAGGLLGLWR